MLLTWFPWARRNLMPFKEAIVTSFPRWKETHLLPWKLSRLMSCQRVEHHQIHKGIQNVGILKGGRGLITQLFTQPLTQLRAAIATNDQGRGLNSKEMLPLVLPIPDIISANHCKQTKIKLICTDYISDSGLGRVLPPFEITTPYPPTPSVYVWEVTPKYFLKTERKN